MPGFIDSTANVIVVTRIPRKTGMEAETYEDYFEAAIALIREGIHRGEYISKFKALLRQESLDEYLKVDIRLSSVAPNKLIDRKNKRKGK